MLTPEQRVPGGDQDASVYWRDVVYGPERLENYWNDRGAHRTELVRAIVDTCPDADSALEVGCHVGTNLRLLARAWPWAIFYGCDINGEAIAYGQERFLELGLPPVFLERASIHSYVGAQRKADVVFSCYALAYTAPADLPGALQGLLAAAQRAVVIAEPMLVDTAWPTAELVNPLPEWRHNYAGLLARLGYGDRLVIRELEAPTTRINAILTASMA